MDRREAARTSLELEIFYSNYSVRTQCDLRAEMMYVACRVYFGFVRTSDLAVRVTQCAQLALFLENHGVICFLVCLKFVEIPSLFFTIFHDSS